MEVPATEATGGSLGEVTGESTSEDTGAITSEATGATTGEAISEAVSAAAGGDIEPNPTGIREEEDAKMNLSPQNWQGGILQQQQVSPGLCPPEGCPPPTEIACIETDYIYDSCFMSVPRELVGAIPEVTAGLDPEADYAVELMIQALTAEEVARTPANGPDTNYYNVTLRLTYAAQVSIIQNGTTYYQGELSDTFFRTVRLCAPAGTTIDGSRFSTVQGQAFVIGFSEDPAEATVQVNVSVCLITQSFATVQLLVPAYGFCVPSECNEVPASVACPPNLFPATCGSANNNNNG